MPSRTAAPSRPKLDRDLVVDRALEVSDAEGLEAVTIRRLAQELSVTPMALYWHFKDKDALLAAVADRMWAETADVLERSLEGAAAGAGDDGWGQLQLTVDALVDVMRRHPAVAPLVPMRALAEEPGLAVTERTLAFLARQGFDLAQSAEIARYVLCSAIMLVTSEPGADVRPVGEAREDDLRAKRLHLASLPEGRYPHISAAAGYMTDCAQPDEYYAQGVEMVVAGVRAQAPGRPPTSGAGPSPRRSRPTR